MVIVTVKKYDESGKLVSIKTTVEEECACMLLDGKRNPRFTSHSEYECYGTDLGILKA